MIDLMIEWAIDFLSDGMGYVLLFVIWSYLIWRTGKLTGQQNILMEMYEFGIEEANQIIEGTYRGGISEEEYQRIVKEQKEKLLKEFPDLFDK